MNFVKNSLLLAADGANGDQFGASTALNGLATVMAVGAPGWEGSLSGQGGVYVLDRSGESWAPRGSVLTASDAAGSDAFGASVALDGPGTMLVVGAPSWEGSLSDQGGVYVFDWNGSAWVQRGSVLTAPDAAASDNFGRSVALSANGLVLAVGASGWEGAASGQGGVYIFDWSGGAWVQRGAVIEASDAAVSDLFGWAVSLDGPGTTLAVGARLWEDAKTSQGGVYILDWSGSAWVQRGSVLVPSTAHASQLFGSSIALSDSGSLLAVGAPGDGDDGSAYLFDWSGSAWVQRSQILYHERPSDLSFYNGYGFGAGIALDGAGDWLAVGADSYDTATTGNTGSVSVLTALSTDISLGGGGATMAISGDVKESGGAPLARIVAAYRRSDGALMGATTSNAGTGAFTVTTPSPGLHFLVVHDAAGTPRNAQILDRITPPASDIHIVFQAGAYTPPPGDAIPFSWSDEEPPPPADVVVSLTTGSFVFTGSALSVLVEPPSTVPPLMGVVDGPCCACDCGRVDAAVMTWEVSAPALGYCIETYCE